MQLFKAGFSTMLIAFVSILLRSYRQSVFSLLMLIASLIIATAGLSAVLIINDGAKQSYQQQSTLLIPNVSHQVLAKSTQQAISKADYAQLRKLGFSELIAVANERGHIYSGKQIRSKRTVDFTGIDTISLIGMQSHAPSTPNNALNNLTSMAMGGSIAALHPDLLAELSSDLSTRLNPITWSIKLNASINENEQYKVLPNFVPIDSPGLGNDVIMDIGELYRLYPKAKISRLLWLNHPLADNHTEKARYNALEAVLPKHLSFTKVQLGEDNAELTKSFHLNLLAMALLMFVVCLFIVLNAINLLLMKRLPWLKVCRQLGISRLALFSAQIIEFILLTFIACVLGLLLGMYLANVVSPSVQATLENLYKVQVGYGSSSLLSILAQVFGISVAGCLTAVVFVYMQIENQLAIAKIVAPATSIKFKQNLLWLSSLVFMLSAYVLLHSSEQLWLLLIGAAITIISGCCVLLASYSNILNWVYRLIPKKMVMLQVSTKQSITLSGKTKVACCAFFIAATSNIGMNLMVDSFRGATENWLQSRLVSDFYFFYKGDKDIEELAKTSQIELIPRYENYIDYQNTLIQQFSYPTTTSFKQAMVFYQVNNVSDAWSLFENGRGVLINQQFAFTFDITLGSQIELIEPLTNSLGKYEVVGIIYDFGSPNKQVLFPLHAFSKEHNKSQVYAIEGSDSKLQVFKEALSNNDISYGESLISAKQLLSFSMQAFDRTFVITDGLNVVTLLVAALSLACSIVVLMNDVRPQNMLIRSLGVSAFKTQLLALFQYLLLCVVALVLATPFGILLSYILIFTINYQAFQWTYPLQIDAVKILIIYLVSLVVVLSVIALPLIKASRKPLIEDIRWLN